jgi:hypothetical protein
MTCDWHASLGGPACGDGVNAGSIDRIHLLPKSAMVPRHGNGRNNNTYVARLQQAYIGGFPCRTRVTTPGHRPNRVLQYCTLDSTPDESTNE